MECLSGQQLRLEVSGTDPRNGSAVVLASAGYDAYDMGATPFLIWRALSMAGAAVVGDLGAWKPRLGLYICDEEPGSRAALHLGRSTIRLLAGLGASLEMQSRTFLEPTGDEDDGEDVAEVRVNFSGWSPVTGEDVVFMAAACETFSTESLTSTIAVAVRVGRPQAPTTIHLWEPQVGIALSCNRGLHAGLMLDAELIQAIAACNAAVDFDPYVS